MCAVDSSLVDICGVSLADLCAAATWSSSFVFAKHYRLDMASSKIISKQVLTAAAAGGCSQQPQCAIAELLPVPGSGL